MWRIQAKAIDWLMNVIKIELHMPKTLEDASAHAANALVTRGAMHFGCSAHA